MADILILVTTTAIVIFHDAASSSALAYPRPRWTSHHPLVSPSLIAIGGIVVLGASSSSSSSHAMDEWHDLDRAEEDEGDDDNEMGGFIKRDRDEAVTISQITETRGITLPSFSSGVFL